jgi:hypothetical protein
MLASIRNKPELADIVSCALFDHLVDKSDQLIRHRALHGRDSSCQAGATNHALRTQ